MPLNTTALEPLYTPWEEPDKHRERGADKDSPASIVTGRRQSRIPIAEALRHDVRGWRENDYPGASETSRLLLQYWFEREHIRNAGTEDEHQFQYYFCQREAIETFVYLKEVRQIETLSDLTGNYAGQNADIAALGITDEEDFWSRYAFKLATGAGKTKVMSLAIVWSYFHAIRETDSPMAKHFLVIAPNLTVYERLKDDFRPEGSRQNVFDSDPLIPPEWRGDWNMSVVLQDEAGGAATGGTIYLTNIHQLYVPKKRRTGANTETYDWMGPPVSKAKALETGAELRERIASHMNVLVLNDEAHHVWDADSAWNEAITSLHDRLRQRGGSGIVAQLDFSATPKNDKGQFFKHIVCDTPLGEAVDAGIVKYPVIGETKRLQESAETDAGYKYQQHLLIGYSRWKESASEWKKSGKKPLLFVMCNNTEEADAITRRLNTDELFADLNGKTINLHTNLKGSIKKGEFVESEKDINDEDLKALRKLSRELDSNSSPYRCIVSVLMLREGWDVRNVTTIVPLRPYSSKANILPEQTLGRGLRRMTPPGSGALEVVRIVEHPAFSRLYEEELSQEGVYAEVVDADEEIKTTVSIFPDANKDDFDELEVVVPRVSRGFSVTPRLEGLTMDDVRKQFTKVSPKKLRLGEKGTMTIEYEGRALFTNELIEKCQIDLPLLSSGVGAVSYYIKQIESICRVKGTHAALAPLVQEFLEKVLFEKELTLFDSEIVNRLGDDDVAEHVRAVFVPLVREKTVRPVEQQREPTPIMLSAWKPYQVTHSESKPTSKAKRTLFNLVPCANALEASFMQFLDRAADVAAFAKNGGPQAVRIDYVKTNGQLAYYVPDFVARTQDGHGYIIETKGREDRDVASKARAARQWCEAATTPERSWEYVYVQQEKFKAFTGNSLEMLASTTGPSLQELVNLPVSEARPSILAILQSAQESSGRQAFIDSATYEALPGRYKKSIDQAVAYFLLIEGKKESELSFSAVFTPLLGSMDEAAKQLIREKLEGELNAAASVANSWFDVRVSGENKGKAEHFSHMAQHLRKLLLYGGGVTPIGLLRSCLDYAFGTVTVEGGVFEAVKKNFVTVPRGLLQRVTSVYDFRNLFIAHQERELDDLDLTRKQLKEWVMLIHELHALSFST